MEISSIKTYLQQILDIFIPKRTKVPKWIFLNLSRLSRRQKHEWVFEFFYEGRAMCDL